MPDIFGELSRDWRAAEDRMRELTHPHLFRHDADNQTPGSTPASLEPQPQKETAMQISSIAADIKGAVENADQWVKEVTETHLPGLLAQAQRYESSPIVQALEAALLPPEVEASIAAMINNLATAYPAAPASAADAAPAPAQ